jgi:hypothetical protein
MPPVARTKLAFVHGLLYTPFVLSSDKSILRIHAISLTYFIEKSNNIYDIKRVHYENVLYDISNDTNLMS